jgi:phosphoglycerate dehydrogenase-like enzyme
MGRVWLSHDVSGLTNRLPPGLSADVWDGRPPWPDTVGEVELFVVPYLVGRPALAPIPEMTRLRVIQTLTAGYEDILPALPDGVTLCNARGVHDASTAELAVALTLASLRGFPDFVRAADAHEWATEHRPALADRTVLIVGYGSVGSAIERRMAPFEVEILRVARTARTTDSGAVHGFADLTRLLPQADVVVLSTPLTEQTRGLVDRSFLRTMRDGGLLVNVARGAVVDTQALLGELVSGRLTAALDVTDPEPLPPDHPLWSAPGLLLTPHVGGDTSAFVPRATKLVADQLRRFADGQQLVNVVAGPGSTLRA